MGFFPNFFSAGETIPLLKIAKLYKENGGRIILFSRGGVFEKLAKNLDCEIVQLENIWKKYLAERKLIDIDKDPFEHFFYKIYNEAFVRSIVEEEINAFKKYDIKAILSAFHLTLSISARVCKIPHITLVSGTCTTPYYRSGNVTFPDGYETPITRMIPSFIKNKITQFYLIYNKINVRNFNKVAKSYDIPLFKTSNDIYFGDYPLVCDDINVLDIIPDDKFPLKNFIGPIFREPFEKHQVIDDDIKNHLNRPGKSILMLMGQGCSPEFFLRILKSLDKTNYNVIAVTTDLIKQDSFPQFSDNILIKKFISPILKVNKMVDLVIIHGGRGTTYTAMYAGKPVVGIPMLFEQQYNLDNLVRKGVGIRISKTFFTEKDLLKSINMIFNNYEYYLENAQALSKKLTKVPGEINAFSRLVEIIEADHK